MVTYEITARIAPEHVAAYERYMRTRHIPEVLATGAFVGASFSRSEPGRYRMRYEARDRGALDAYLTEHAPRLRTDFLAHFSQGAELSREEWEVVQQW